MLDGWVTTSNRVYPPSVSDVVETVRELCARELEPIVQRIDADAFYPETVLRAFGRAGAFACHLPGETPGGPDLVTANRAMAAAGEYCLSTSFCMWCQNALAWYIFASENEALKAGLGRRVAVGDALGGTALSNPMKAFFGIEQVRLKGTRIDGGYMVRGALPYVSNLGNDHYFGAVFEIADVPRRYVMTIVPCAAQGVKLSDSTKFVALDGTRTFSVQLRDAIIPDSFILADPSDGFIKRIRAGFVLLQAGMAIGLIRSCIALMNQVRGPLGHVNKYLDAQPEHLAEQLRAIEASVELLAATPFEPDQGYWRSVVEARLAAGEAAVAAAHAAMLHCGARGYIANAVAQRRLRESYFVAIVTPAIKQLKKMLADMAN
jgi:alkylation response protein AidB-like acyl-CoA dehydrogenase